MPALSLGQKILQLQGLVGTQDATDDQQQFILDMHARSHAGTKTSHLTDGQVRYIESHGRATTTGTENRRPTC